MIPKTIHYCWFGRAPLPASARVHTEGWMRLHPDYRLVQWNEDNFDTNCCAYVREAYERRRFAFVSDYARGVALLCQGGVYLDTDVELIGRLDSLLSDEAFFGFEEGNLVATSTIGCRPGHPFIRRYLDQYHGRKFVQEDGSLDLTTNVIIMNRLLADEGLRLDGTEQRLAGGIHCYPKQFFSPLDYIHFIDHRDSRTIAIHHYQHSWGGPLDRFKRCLARALASLLGPSLFGRLRRLRAKIRPRR